MKYASLGTVIERTLRLEDLAVAFADKLEELGEAESDGLIDRARLIARARWMAEMEDRSFQEDEKLNEAVTRLSETLNEYAPPLAYFGAHQGDGSDFGFWVDWDAIEHDVHDGEIIKVENLGEAPDDWKGYVLEVNDHGNAALYDAEGAEVWAVV